MLAATASVKTVATGQATITVEPHRAGQDRDDGECDCEIQKAAHAQFLNVAEMRQVGAVTRG